MLRISSGEAFSRICLTRLYSWIDIPTIGDDWIRELSLRDANSIRCDLIGKRPETSCKSLIAT